MPLEACAICCDEKLSEFLQGPPEFRCCRDFLACNRRALKRLRGERVGASSTTVPVNGEPPRVSQSQLTFDGEQLGLELGDAAA